MKDSNDVSKLFEEIGASANAYREITRAERAGEALARWPLLSTLQEDIAKSGSPDDASLLNIPLGRRQEPQLPKVMREEPEVSLLAERERQEPVSQQGYKPSPLGAWAKLEEAVEPPVLQEPVWGARAAVQTPVAPVASARPLVQEPTDREDGLSLAAKLALHGEDTAVAPAKNPVPERKQGKGLQDVLLRILGTADDSGVTSPAAGRNEPASLGALNPGQNFVRQAEASRHELFREPQSVSQESDELASHGQAPFSLTQRLNRL